MLHFEKYSQQFATFFDRIHDFCIEIWEEYFSAQLIHFPIRTILNSNVVQEFHSISEVLPKKKIAEELYFNSKIR